MAMIKAIIQKVLSPSILANYTEFLGSIEGFILTDVPKSTVSALAKLQLSDSIDWKITSYEARGVGSSEPVYSAGYDYASVVIPDEESVAEAADLLKKCLKGEMLSDESFLDGE